MIKLNEINYSKSFYNQKDKIQEHIRLRCNRKVYATAYCIVYLKNRSQIERMVWAVEDVLL
jgi:hypothetical protein